MVGPRETSSHGAATPTSPWPPPSAVNRLSGGGEAQKVAIGRAMAQETSVLLLDEPTSNLDLRNQLEVLDIIREMAADRGVAAIVTMHDLNLALRFADKFILMRGGTI